jgi:hypothetical protein
LARQRKSVQRSIGICVAGQFTAEAKPPASRIDGALGQFEGFAALALDDFAVA